MTYGADIAWLNLPTLFVMEGVYLPLGLDPSKTILRRQNQVNTIVRTKVGALLAGAPGFWFPVLGPTQNAAVASGEF